MSRVEAARQLCKDAEEFLRVERQAEARQELRWVMHLSEGILAMELLRQGRAGALGTKLDRRIEAFNALLDVHLGKLDLLGWFGRG